MPRTFSRGSPITADTVFEFIGHIHPPEEEEMLVRIRTTFCPEPPLDEQDIFDLFQLFRDVLDNFQRMQRHWLDFHPGTSSGGTGDHVREWLDPRVELLAAAIAEFQLRSGPANLV